MAHSTAYGLVLIILSSTTFTLSASEKTITCDQSEDIELLTNNIFDLDDPQTIFLHRWANWLHIKTKEKTLINEIAFFIKKCEVSQDDLEELQRYLKSKKYIRDARVSNPESSDKIKIETWDNWSLLPTVDFGRKGGKNKYAIGIKDRNFLGLGIGVELESFTSDQRSGYKLDTHFPLFLNKNINASVRLTSNDDGGSEQVYITKEFASFDTQSAFQAGFHNYSQNDTLYKGGKIFNQFNHQQKYSTVSWKWLENDSTDDTLRFGIGFTNEQHLFSTISTPLSDTVGVLPKDREFSYPFFSAEYIQKDFRQFTNLNLINHIEDFNLGWHLTGEVGVDISKRTPSSGLIWRSSISKGFQTYHNAYWFSKVALEGEYFNSSSNSDRAMLSISNEYFHKVNEHWAGYAQNISKFSKNHFQDTPVVLGGETGLRGYPLQYGHGEHSTQFTLEARYYPKINIYKLLELGAAAFIDTGRVYKQESTSLNQSEWLTSIGIGARFYSTQTSDANVIHVDIIKPLSNDESVNGLEFRISTKHSF